jgi:hypothetical protein
VLRIKSARQLAVGMLLLCAAARACAWLDWQLPPRTQSEWVLQEAVVNGLPTQVLELKSELSGDELLAYFKRRWAVLGKPRERRGSDGRSLAVQRDGVQMVLQLKPPPARGSHALLSQMNLAERRKDFVPAELPALPQARLLQVTESRDGARRSRLVQYSSPVAFEVTQNQLQRHWQRWSTLHQHSGGAPGARQWLAAYQQGPRSVDLVLTQSAGQTQILINLLDTQP